MKMDMYYYLRAVQWYVLIFHVFHHRKDPAISSEKIQSFLLFSSKKMHIKALFAPNDYEIKTH